MTKRFLSHSPEERAALLKAKQERFLGRVAEVLGSDPNASRFHQRGGRHPVRTKPRGRVKLRSGRGLRTTRGLTRKNLGAISCVL
jgi:hypothetical protein